MTFPTDFWILEEVSRYAPASCSFLRSLNHIRVVVRRGGCQLRCRPRHLTMVQNYVVHHQKPSCSVDIHSLDHIDKSEFHSCLPRD
ncbi:hypothetical protein TNCV_1001351 [Trichonephila clavipes]|nr:hypothetical protein TNCV_1001351 [Trichonephila clavipes]